MTLKIRESGIWNRLKRSNLLFILQTVSDPTDGEDQTGTASGFQLAAKQTDVDIGKLFVGRIFKKRAELCP